MAVDILGHTVHDNVGSVVKRVLDVWREEGIVHNDHNSMPVRNSSNGADIHQAQSRVAGRLNPDQLRLVGTDQVLNIQLDRRREGDVHAVGSGDLGEIAMGAAIDIRDGNDVRAGGEGLQDDSSCGRAGGESQGVAGVLKCSDSFLEIVPAVYTIKTGYTRSLSGVGSYLFGFELLVYSYSPMGLPTADWAKVVEREIWTHVSGATEIRAGFCCTHRSNDSASDGIVRRTRMDSQSAELVHGRGRARRGVDGMFSVRHDGACGSKVSGPEGCDW